MEMQILFYNTLYGTTFNDVEDEFDDTPDALAIFSILIESGDHNKAFDPIVKSNLKKFYLCYKIIDCQSTDLQHIKHQNTDGGRFFKGPPLRRWLPKDTDSFFQYHGSKSSPIFTGDCDETAIWFIFKVYKKM